MRWKTVVVGALAFVAAHFVVRAAWPWLDSGRGESPWFLNAGRGVAITAGLLFLAAALRSGVAAADRRTAVQHGLDFALGAVAAMAIVLFTIGPGTLFPIVIVIGAVVIAAAALAGALAGWGCRALAGFAD
jgi:hypothetical protein